MLFALSTGLLYATVALASYGNNLNYRSPSHHHASLGISLSKVVKRGVPGGGYVNPSDLNFTHGVSSGDPYPNSVILWTRIAPQEDDDKSNATVSGFVPLYNHDTQSYVKASSSPICVNWVISPHKDLSKPVDGSRAYTTSDIDYTVKVEAHHLKPFTTYYYQFEVCNSNKKSAVGRTKTLPPKDDDSVKKISLAVYSCSNYPFGFFNAFGNPVRKDSVDYVIHLGDFIYEYKNGDYGWGNSLGRIPLPDKETYSLYDYRKRHATYRTDLDTVLSAQYYPWIPTWDDHEVSDNTYRDGASELNNTESSFVADGGVSVDQRKMNAVRAYFEWMPIRQVDMDDNLRIWRTFSFGTLFDLVMLDTRQYDRSITDLYWNTEYIYEISNDAGRSMMGSRQEHYFYNFLSASDKRGATWRVVGSQTVFNKLNESIVLSGAQQGGVPLDVDAWDGYQANKNRTFNHLYNNNIGNNIFISGDSHASWVHDLVWNGEKPYNSKTGAGAIGVEFAGSAVSSPCPYGANISLAGANAFSQWLTEHNEQLQWSDLYYRGYFELHITHEEVKANYFGMPTLLTRNPYEISLANFTVKNGANKLTRPVAGGLAESGSLKNGKVKQTNLTANTANGTYFISHFDQKVL